MKKVGRPRGLVRMPSPSKKGLASKKYSRSLDATNILFAENKVFKKPKSKKNKIFNPNAKYYQGGGYVDIELDDAEIQRYIDGGYVVEEVNDPAIPQLSRFNPGGSPCPRGQMRDASGKCVNYNWGSGNIQAVDSYAGMYGGYDSSGVKNLSQVQASAKKGKKFSDYILRGGKSRADVARNLGKNAGAYYGMPGEALEPVNYTKAGLDKYTTDIKNAKKNYEAKEKDYQNYLKSKEKASKGKMDTSKYAKQYDEKGWSQYDVNTKEGRGPDAEYSAKEARQNWGDPEEWKKFTGLVSNAATAIPLLGAAGAMGSASAAILENPYVQAGLTAYGVNEAVTNTLPEAYKDFSEGRYWEGLGNTAMAGLDFIPGAGLASKGAKLGYKGLKGAVNYGNDVIQTSKQAGKFALPKYKNVYRVEHAGFDKAANPDKLTGRWFADNPVETKFYAQNLKDPVTGEVIRDVDAPTRVMQQRLPEYKVQQNFGAGMPEEARTMSMGRGDFTNTELDEMLGAGAGDRFTKGVFTESDLNAMETAPFLFRKEEGILDADMVNKIRGNTNAGRFSSGKSTVFDSQDKAVDYLFDEASKIYKPKSKYSQYLPFKEGGALERFTNGGGPGDGIQELSEFVSYSDKAKSKKQLSLMQELSAARKAYQNFTKENQGKSWYFKTADGASSIENLTRGIKRYQDELVKAREEVKAQKVEAERLSKKLKTEITVRDLNKPKKLQQKLMTALDANRQNMDTRDIADINNQYRLADVDPKAMQGSGANAQYSAKEAEAAWKPEVMQDVGKYAHAAAMGIVGLASAGALGPALIGEAGSGTGAAAGTANLIREGVRGAGHLLRNPWIQAGLTGNAAYQIGKDPRATIEGLATTGVEAYDLVKDPSKIPGAFTGEEQNRFGENYGSGVGDVLNVASLSIPGLSLLKKGRDFTKTSKGFELAANYWKPVKDTYKAGIKGFGKVVAPVTEANIPAYGAAVADMVTGGRGATEFVNRAGILLRNAPAWAKPTVSNALKGYTLFKAGDGIMQSTEGLSSGNKAQFNEGVKKVTDSTIDAAGVLTNFNHLYNLTTPLNVIARGEELKNDFKEGRFDANTAFSALRMLNSVKGMPYHRSQVLPLQDPAFKGATHLKFGRVRDFINKRNARMKLQKGGIITSASNREIEDLIKRGFIVEELD